MTLYHEWWSDYKDAVRKGDRFGVTVLLGVGVGLVVFSPFFVLVEIIYQISNYFIDSD